MRCFLAIATLFAASVAGAQTSWIMRGFDLNRTGANTKESALNPTNVNTGQFGKLFSRDVDGQIYAQPQIVPNVSVPGKGQFTIVYVETMHDSVYAFDAETPGNNTPLWQRSFIDEPNGITTIPYQYLTGFPDIHPEVGIVSTPAIDRAKNLMYVLVRTLEGDPNNDASYHQRLHALDLRTGKEKLGGPVEITASKPGNGDGSVGGVVTYDARRQNQRPALVFANGNIYIASASHGDNGPYHGWVLAYNASNLKLKASFCTTPNAGLGGIWMSGHAMPVDADGNLYLATGNGNFDPAAGDFGDSFVKLNGNTLAVMDYFTPFNQSDLESYDADLGSCGPILIPNTNLLIGGSKESKLYVMNRTNMGHFNAADDSNVQQWWYAGNGHMHGSPVYWKGQSVNNVYMWSEDDRLRAFRLTNNVFDPNPVATGAIQAPPGMPGGFLTVTSDGAKVASAIVWATLPFEGNANWNTVPGVLRAFRASDLQELWNSRMIPADDYGSFAKFNPAPVVNGKVYVPTFSNKLVVYGLLPPVAPSAPSAVKAEAGDAQVALTWAPTQSAASYEVLRGPSGGPFTKIADVTGDPIYIDNSVTNGQIYTYVVDAKNTYGTSDLSNEATATPLAIPAETGTGITATYYNDPSDNTYFRSLALKRKDATIDFDWGGGSPDASVQTDHFSSTWNGFVVARQTGFYTFQTITDDGVRLWVKDKLVVDNWTDHGPTSDFTGKILMVAGKKYPIQMEMYENGGGAVARLWWTGPGVPTYVPVPATSLFQLSPMGQVVKPNTDGALDIEATFDTDGFSFAANPADGDIGYLHQTYAAEFLPVSFSDENNVFVLNVGPTFNGAKNMISANGQSLLIPISSAKKLWVLGTSVNGTQSGTFRLNYSDGTSTDVPIAMTDWSAPSPRNGERLAGRYDRRHSPAGNVVMTTSVYRYAVLADVTKRLVSIQLPTNADMKVMAITVQR